MELNKIEREFVNKYKTIASESRNQPELIKDVTFLEMLVISLASTNLAIAKTALETVHILIQNKSNHSALCSTFGILEAVRCSSERLSDENMSMMAKQIICVLTGPAYGTRSRRKKQDQLYVEHDQTHTQLTKQLILYIHGLSLSNQKILEEALIKQKGVVSFQMNLAQHICILRVLKNVSPRALAKIIFSKIKSEVKLVVKSTLQKEILVSLSDDDEEESCSDLPPYLPEEDSPVRNKAISVLGQWKANASGAIQWFQKSFYW